MRETCSNRPFPTSVLSAETGVDRYSWPRNDKGSFSHLVVKVIFVVASAMVDPHKQPHHGAPRRLILHYQQTPDTCIHMLSLCQVQIPRCLNTEDTYGWTLKIIHAQRHWTKGPRLLFQLQLCDLFVCLPQRFFQGLAKQREGNRG